MNKFKFVAFGAMMVLPIIATLKLSNEIGALYVLSYLVLISVATFVLYKVDKSRSESGEWRIPEKVLHLCEFFGGWAVAFFAQQKLRHKTVKAKYQIIYWSIAVIQQIIAFEYIQNWQHIRAIFS